MSPGADKKEKGEAAANALAIFLTAIRVPSVRRRFVDAPEDTLVEIFQGQDASPADIEPVKGFLESLTYEELRFVSDLNIELVEAGLTASTGDGKHTIGKL